MQQFMVTQQGTRISVHKLLARIAWSWTYAEAKTTNPHNAAENIGMKRHLANSATNLNRAEVHAKGNWEAKA